MLDTIITGTGNSRTIKTVPNAMTLYSNWTDALQAMIDGSFPIDIGPLNLAGLLQKGTDLNKANLLSDETAALYGKDGSATPDEIFAAIPAPLNGKANIATGYYIGTGIAVDSNHPIIISLPIETKLLFVMDPNYSGGLFLKPATGFSFVNYQSSPIVKLSVTWQENNVEWFYSANDPQNRALNRENVHYYYVCIG